MFEIPQTVNGHEVVAFVKRHKADSNEAAVMVRDSSSERYGRQGLSYIVWSYNMADDEAYWGHYDLSYHEALEVLFKKKVEGFGWKEKGATV